MKTAADDNDLKKQGKLSRELMANSVRVPPEPKSNGKADEGTGTTTVAKEQDSRPPQAERIAALAAGADLFRSPEGEGYATVPVDDHLETGRIRSTLFRDWITNLFMDTEKRPPGSQAMEEALRGLEARARLKSPTHPVHVRVAQEGETLYLDLGDECWRAVAITAEGWKIVAKPPVRFRRPKGLLALPDPVRGGAISELRDFVNVPPAVNVAKGGVEDHGWVLLVAFLIGSLHPTGPYPLLVLQGEQGSCKSTTGRVVRYIVDPNAIMDRKLPRDGQELSIACTSNWLLNYDNMSGIPLWLSDDLARVATGGGFGTRKLYSDDEESLFYARRPVILNGIDELIERGDLRERAIILRLPSIPPEERREESEFWEALKKARPRILGALLDAASAALRDRATIKMPKKPRMADFACWVVAAETGLGWSAGTFMAAYDRAAEEAIAAGLEADAVASAVLRLVGAGEYAGTATELLDALNALRKEDERAPRGWPANARALRSCLNRAAPLLRPRGVTLTYAKGKNRRITIGQAPQSTDETVEQSSSEENMGDGRVGATDAADD